MASNLYTKIIGDHLGIDDYLASKVYEEINKYWYLDWSESSLTEIKWMAERAFESLNVII